MLWTLVKVILFFAVVMGLALTAGRLSEGGEALRLTLAGTEYTLSPMMAVLAAVALFIAIWVFLKLLGITLAFIRFLAGDTTALNRYFRRKREKRGYDALAEGMLAIASGEGKQAQVLAAKADKYLPRPEIARLLTAQAAEAAGDTKKACQAYKDMLSDDRTRFVGVRGLMRQKLDEGDTQTALALAQKAYAIKPRHEEVQDALLRLETETGHWGAARKVLEDKVRDGRLPKDVYKRRDAVMALQEAKGVLEDGATIEAREAAIAANRKSPDLIPAAVMAARGYITAGEMKNAGRVIHKAWAAQPHPSLAAAYADIAPDESPEARVKRFRNLIAQNRGHVESKLLEAELLLAAEDFPAARRAMEGVIDKHPTARAMTIMAAIERGEGSEDHVVRGWLARALTAPRGPQWVCDKCQNIMADWAPTCDSCGGFDTLSWREAPGGGVPVGNGAEMLPLIVGRIETPRADPAPQADDTEITLDPADHIEARAPVRPGYVEPDPLAEAGPAVPDDPAAADLNAGEAKPEAR